MMQTIYRFLFDLCKSGFQILRRRGGRIRHETIGKVMLDIDQQTPHCRGNPRIWRHNHNRNGQLLRDGSAVQGTCPAKGHKREIPRVAATADG